MHLSREELKAKAVAEIDRRTNEIIALSADILAHPETGFFETRTSEVVQQKFGSMGLAFEAELARTGVKARMSGGKPGPTVGILGELDAILVPESPVADAQTGAAHGCGHNAQIASMIGAGGLGHDVLTSLRRLDIGSGLEAGVAITLLAITLDRLSQAFANRAPRVHSDVAVPWWMRNRILVGGFALAIATWCLAGWVPGLQRYPDSLTVTTAPLWDALVKWININFFDQLEFAKNAILLNVMIPFKRFLLALPWAGVILLLGVAGWHIGGWRLSLLVAALAMFVALVGLWQKAMITVYLCGVSVLIATLIGLPLGIWASANDRVHKVVQVIIDTLQTLPSFVYLIPVVMLFRVGDFAAMLAVVAYSIPPAVRYADHGLRQVPTHLVEAAQAMGCNRRQLLWRVKLPNALPDIMLGINQTIMMALSMLVITALVGTRDLGQEVYIALTKADTGRGVVAGLAVAFIAIIADRMINAWAAQRKQRLGIAY